MNDGLVKRTALVTGATKGIGRAITLALARAGASVAVVGRTTADLRTLLSDLDGLGCSAVALTADLAEAGAIDRIHREAIDRLGLVDILINNAAIGASRFDSLLVDMEESAWEETLELNLNVPFKLCRRLVPSMVARQFGRVINIASVMGLRGSVRGSAYSASKHGLIGLTRSLALEVADTGVTVNAICPGPTVTSMNDRRLAQQSHQTGRSTEELIAERMPIGRRVDPDEIGLLATYLATEAADAITGSVIPIDGGLLARC